MTRRQLLRWLHPLLMVLLICAPMPVAAQRPTLQTEAAEEVERIFAAMTPEQRVGQLFLVTFPGNDLGEESPAASVVRDLLVGGVVLRPTNGNFLTNTMTVTQIITLTNGLQGLSAQGAEALGEGIPYVPLFVGVELPGEQISVDEGLPREVMSEAITPMSIGATWNPGNAEMVGRMLGSQLETLGINLLLGPALDVLASPRPELRGDLGASIFGGDPYWVSQMGRAFVRGVHDGAGSRVAVVAQHFPGLGASDRRPDEEIATIQKSLDELRLSELPPFFAATALRADDAGMVDGLMPANIRYRGLQGNIRQLTQPISLDAVNLPTIMALPEFQPWREQGGILVSDALGVPALRRFYADTVGAFPPRRAAQQAFFAGNDLLFTADFGQSDEWAEQLANLRSTRDFFVDTYNSTPDFRARVDGSVRRLLTLKWRLTEGDFSLEAVTAERDLNAWAEMARQYEGEAARIAQEAATLLYPDPAERAALLPAPPLPSETILIITDAHPVRECPACPARPYIPPRAFEQALLARYGPRASGQVSNERLISITFEELNDFLNDDLEDDEAREQIEQNLVEADWIIFLMGRVSLNNDEVPESDAIKNFLREPREQLRQGARLLVFAFAAPYYLDATEISKLTAFYGLYSPSPSFIEVAAKLLFQEFNPPGNSPVSVPGLNYDLISELEPDPGQILQLEITNLQPVAGASPSAIDVSVGDAITLRTGVIVDRNGRQVPDGTPVTFILGYPAERVELPRITTTTLNGIAETMVVLDRVGQLEIKAISEPASQSTTLLLTIAGEGPGILATEVPPPTATPTETPSPTATTSPTRTPRPPTRTPRPATATPTEAPPSFLGINSGAGRIGWWSLWLALGSMLLAAALSTIIQPPDSTTLVVRRFLLACSWGLVTYIAYLLAMGLGLTPESWSGINATWIVFAAALMPWLWEQLRRPT